MRDAIAKAKLDILHEVRHQKKRENKEKDGEMIHVPLATRFIQDLVGNIFFGELDRMAHEFPSTLKAKTEVQIFEEVTRQISTVKRSLRDKLAAWVSGEGRKEQL